MLLELLTSWVKQASVSSVHLILSQSPLVTGDMTVLLVTFVIVTGESNGQCQLKRRGLPPQCVLHCSMPTFICWMRAVIVPPPTTTNLTVTDRAVYHNFSQLVKTILFARHQSPVELKQTDPTGWLRNQHAYSLNVWLLSLYSVFPKASIFHKSVITYDNIGGTLHFGFPPLWYTAGNPILLHLSLICVHDICGERNAAVVAGSSKTGFLLQKLKCSFQLIAGLSGAQSSWQRQSISRNFAHCQCEQLFFYMKVVGNGP